MRLAIQESPATGTRPSPRAIAAVLEALAARFGNRLVTSLAVRQQHANTTTWLENQPADAVVFAQNAEDVREIVNTARRAKKTSAGYDLTRLLIGSEGTLGIITELTLKLHGIPEAISAGVCPFPSVEAACNATIAAIQSGIPVARIELLDQLMIKACNAYSKPSLPENPMLFVEVHGSPAGVAEQAERF